MKTYRSLRLAQKYPNMRPTTRSQLMAACWYVFDLPVHDIFKASHAVQVIFGGGIIATTRTPRYPDLSFRDWGIKLRQLWEEAVRNHPRIFEVALAENKISDARRGEVLMLLEESYGRKKTKTEIHL